MFDSCPWKTWSHNSSKIPELAGCQATITPRLLGGWLVSAHQDLFQCRKDRVTFWHIPWHLGNGVQAHKRGPLGKKAGRCCYQWMVQSFFSRVFCVKICFDAAQFSSNISSKEKLPESDEGKFQTEPLIKASLVISLEIHLHLLAPLQRIIFLLLLSSLCCNVIFSHKSNSTIHISLLHQLTCSLSDLVLWNIPKLSFMHTE